MGRIRSIKPDFFVDEDIGKLEPITRIVYEGLWCHADKSGRLEYRPEYLKTQIIPYDTADINEQLAILCSPKTRTGIPFTIKYEVEGVPFLQIIAWNKHQRPHHTESESTLPPPPESVLEQLFNGRGMVKQRLTNGYLTDGREGKGKERKGVEAAPLKFHQEATQVIIYLNKTAGTHFEPTNKEWLGKVSARMREGHTLEDFQLVIDEKCRQWLNDNRMKAYLRPATLFTANHMEEYLSEANQRRRKESV